MKCPRCLKRMQSETGNYEMFHARLDMVMCQKCYHIIHGWEIKRGVALGLKVVKGQIKISRNTTTDTDSEFSKFGNWTPDSDFPTFGKEPIMMNEEVRRIHMRAFDPRPIAISRFRPPIAPLGSSDPFRGFVLKDEIEGKVGSHE